MRYLLVKSKFSHILAMHASDHVREVPPDGQVPRLQDRDPINQANFPVNFFLNKSNFRLLYSERSN